MDADLKTHPALGWDYYRSICFSLKMMDAPTPLIKLRDEACTLTDQLLSANFSLP
jgi:hypothetical protein